MTLRFYDFEDIIVSLRLNNTKKETDMFPYRSPFAEVKSDRSALCGSSYGANACASAAVETCVSVDLILAVAFGNSACRALCSTSAAGNAIIRNFISH